MASDRTAQTPDVRIAHLGLGAFHRAHQAFYVECANRLARAAGEPTWGIAAFTGRKPGVARTLNAQGNRYSLLIRDSHADRVEQVTSIVAAHDGADTDAWLRTLSAPQVVILTLTVTEAGYVTDRHGALDMAHPVINSDIAAVRAGRMPASAPARIAWGLERRREAGGGAITIAPCDNVSDNGAVARQVTRRFAELLDPSLPDWIDESVTFVSSMVDRITPATSEGDISDVLRLTGLRDAATVVTEPFSEWVLAGSFAAGRPDLQAVGARFVADVIPHEQRKLWLLNGAHSLLAYVGSARGHNYVASAITDPECRRLVDDWWDLACTAIAMSPEELRDYCAALLQRFTNARIHHRLEQIAADGSQKIRLRFMPMLRAERAAGRMPSVVVIVLAAWIAHLRGESCEVTDELKWLTAAQGPLPTAVPRVLSMLDPALADDHELAAAVLAGCKATGRR